MPGLRFSIWKMGIRRDGRRKAERGILAGVALTKLKFVGHSTVRAVTDGNNLLSSFLQFLETVTYCCSSWHADSAIHEKMSSTSCAKSEALRWRFVQMFLLNSLSCVDIFTLIYMCYFDIRSSIWMRFHFHMSIVLYRIRFNGIQLSLLHCEW